MAIETGICLPPAANWLLLSRAERKCTRAAEQIRTTQLTFSQLDDGW